MKTTILSLALVSLSFFAFSQERKVLFIGIDGVRFDALQQANTPTMDSLMNNGLFTYDSWHLGITVSGPSWSTMLTGVWESKHGVTNNNYTNANYNEYPYFVKRAKEVKPDLKAVQIITWNPMDDASNGTGGYVFNAGWDESIDVGTHGQGLVTAAAIQKLQDPDLDVLFIHYDETDVTGHSTGFSTINNAYINAIQGADQEIRQVLYALKNRPNYANEDWLILATTDHGGIGLGHGGNTNAERHIWWWASGPSVPNMQINCQDPGSVQIGNLDPTKVPDCPVLADIAVTALHHLIYEFGVPNVIHPEWNLDGKSWLSMAAYIEESNDKSFAFEVYPNPNEGQFLIKLPENMKQASFEIIDQIGRVIDKRQINGNYSSAIDISNYNSGVYFLRVKEGDRIGERKIIKK